MCGDAVDRASLYAVLVEKIVVLTFPPVALGWGHTSLGDKVSAFVYQMFLDVGYEILQDAGPCFATHMFFNLNRRILIFKQSVLSLFENHVFPTSMAAFERQSV